MFGVRDYRQDAQENEEVFRNVLREMKLNRGKRNSGCYIPKDLETELAVDAFFEKYSAGQRCGRFTVSNFSRPSKDSAVISFEDVAPLSGGGADWEYLVRPDNSVEFRDVTGVFMS